MTDYAYNAAHRWYWDVEFARWISPDSTSMKVAVVAADPVEANAEARRAAERIWKDEARQLSVRRMVRVGPVHNVTEAA